MELTLKDAVRLIDDGKEDIAKLAQNKDLQDYLNRVEDVGKDVLLKLSEDEIGGAVSLLQSVVLLDLIEDANFKMAMLMMANGDEFGNMMVVALKMAVGLSVVEEWR